MHILYNYFQICLRVDRRMLSNLSYVDSACIRLYGVSGLVCYDVVNAFYSYSCYLYIQLSYLCVLQWPYSNCHYWLFLEELLFHRIRHVGVVSHNQIELSHRRVMQSKATKNTLKHDSS